MMQLKDISVVPDIGKNFISIGSLLKAGGNMRGNDNVLIVE